MPGSRRARGEGTYEQLPSGLWRCRIKWQGRIVTGEAKPTRAEAGRSAQAALAKEKNGGVAPARGRSWSTFAQGWAEERAKRLSPTTAETEGHWAAYVRKDLLGVKPVDRLTSADLNAWRDRLGVSPNTSHNLCGWVNQMMRAAGSDARVDVPARKPHQRRPLSTNERTAMREFIDTLDPETRTMMLLCWAMGLRRSEACGLRHEDRDGEGVRIERTIVVTKGHLVERPKTKTARSAGWVPIPPFMDELIGHGRKGFVVNGEIKTPPNPKALSSRYEHAIRGHDLRRVPYLGPHTLRRTYGMSLLESGADVVTAAEAMRHDPKMLLDEYSRSREDLKTSAAKRAFEGFTLRRKDDEKAG